MLNWYSKKSKFTVCTDFPTGWHNCLLLYWCTVWHADMPTSFCLLLCNDSAKCHILWCGNLG